MTRSPTAPLSTLLAAAAGAVFAGHAAAQLNDVLQTPNPDNAGIQKTYHEIQFDGSIHTEFMTEPLWGVGSTAPYGHDGRSINLREVILRHGGEAATSRDRFAALAEYDRVAIESFLQTLVLFPPPDTASNLDPGNPAAAGYPQLGHGSIKLSVLFNDPTDPE